MKRTNGYAIARCQYEPQYRGYMTSFAAKDGKFYGAVSADKIARFNTKLEAKAELSRLASIYKSTDGWLIIGPCGGVTSY